MPWRQRPDGAWEVRGYHDVIAALRDPHLATVGGAVRERVHALSPDLMLCLQRDTLTRWEALVPGEVELVSRMGRSFGATAAVLVLGLPETTVNELSGLAEQIWQDSAKAGSSDVSQQASEATATLASAFNDQASTHVQAFVALTQSLPALVSNVMVHSLRANHRWPEVDQASSAAAAATPPAADAGMATIGRAQCDEWLRCCAPVRRVFRKVQSPLSVNGQTLDIGTAVTIDLESANLDTAVFPEPGRVMPEGRGVAHVAFGMPPHACRGASVVQTALSAFLGAWSAFCAAHHVVLLEAEAESDFVAMRAWKRAVLRVEAA